MRCQLEHAIVHKQQANRQIKSATGQYDIQRFARTWPDHGAWRLITSKDLAISRPSKADQAVGSLDGVMQLPQARQRPRRVEVHRAALITRGFLSIEYATAQGGGDAYHAVELMLADKLTPLAGNVLLILGRNDVIGRAVHAILIKNSRTISCPPASAAWANSKARREEGAWAAENTAIANFMEHSASKRGPMIKPLPRKSPP